MNIANLGKSIKKEREFRKLTQEQLSELLDVSTHYIYELERGTRIPSLPLLIKLSEVLHVSADRLLSDTAAENNAVNPQMLNDLINTLTDEQKQNLYNIINVLMPYLKI